MQYYAKRFKIEDRIMINKYIQRVINTSNVHTDPDPHKHTLNHVQLFKCRYIETNPQHNLQRNRQSRLYVNKNKTCR